MDQPPSDRIEDAAREAARPPEPHEGLGLVDDLVMALRLFSRLPTGGSPHRRPDLNRIAMALPLASLVMGVGPALVLLAGVLVGLPHFFAAALAVSAAVVVSGAMAEDALADAMDGLFGGQTVARRLEIMKDSRHGTYGVAALCLSLVLRVTALGAAAAISPLAAAAIWLAAAVGGRSGALWLAVALPPARTEGLAADAGRLGWQPFAIGTVFALLLMFILAGPATSVLALAAALVLTAGIAAGWTLLVRRLVGGQTGDLIGAGGALIEIGILAALLPFV